jgi:hypothetical protein
VSHSRHIGTISKKPADDSRGVQALGDPGGAETPVRTRSIIFATRPFFATTGAGTGSTQPRREPGAQTTTG